jgi:hypothetical protein
MTKKTRKRELSHQIKSMSLFMNGMSIENHRIICGNRGKNLSQFINFSFTAFSSPTSWPNNHCNNIYALHRCC